MEHESFEDSEVAELLNRDYVSIKVDREERPDVDHLYMSVCQALTGQGGWPLTVIMTPDKKPFFAGTYYPKQRKHGRPGLTDILPQISAKWREDQARIEQTGQQIIEETQKRMLSNLEGELSEETLHEAFNAYNRVFDEAFGGFGRAPKFPASHNLSFLLRYYKQTGEERALQIAETTLKAMSRGGVYDHVGFGFARYSTDDKWLVPHFEKMLYDNALLTMTYIEAYQLTGNTQYADVAEQIIAYVLRDMTDPEGGFYSAEDADSEGEEGKFYVWTADEIELVLGIDEGDLYSEVYGITEEGNFEDRSIPNRIEASLDSIARRKGMELQQLQSRLEASRIKLFEHREKRVHPHKDDKVLTSWNGLMIMALAKAAKALQKQEYAEAAAKAVAFIKAKLVREDGRLLARYRDGQAAFPGYVDDYAFLVWGLIELYESTFDLNYMKMAIKLNDDMLSLFWDEEKGGLYFNGHDGEQLFTRTKEIYDGAMPSGNSAAALNLLKLAQYTYNAAYSQKAEELLQAFAGAVARYPSGHALLLIAYQYAYSPAKEIVIAGDPSREDTQAMLRAVQQKFLPNTILVLNPSGSSEGDAISLTMPITEGKTPLGGRATAYICENFSCHSPTNDLEELEELE
jgi:uncharacterized protein YyaL (SSP411 family)